MALGETLRRAREARRISLNQAALETRIRQAVLEALEDSDFTGVPPRPFLRGLLRNYALYLHLDADTILDEYDYETGHKPAIAQPPPPEPQVLPPAAAPTKTIPEQPYRSAPLQRPEQPSTSPPSQRPEEPFTFPPFQIPTAPKMSGDADVGGPNALPPVPETVYHVAPELEPAPPEPTPPLNLAQEPPTLARRIGSTRIPEAVALISLAAALFILVSVGFTAFQNFRIPFATSPTAQRTRIPTVTVPVGSTPTGIPTLPQTALPPTLVSAVVTTTIGTGTPTVLAAGNLTPTLPLGTPTFDVPADAQMTLELQANGAMGAWVVVDGDTSFNGTLTGESRTFIARARIFVQIKNIENGRVFFQGTRILPRNQAERSELSRAWFINPLGTPIIVPPTPFPVPVEPTGPATLTLVPSATSTRTATATATSTQTATRTPTPSATPSSTATASQTPSATRTMTASATASSTNTVTATASATHTATATNTHTPTASRTHTPTASRTHTPTASRTHTPTASRTHTPTAATIQAATPIATITQAALPSPNRSPTTTATRTPTRTGTATSIGIVTRTPTRTQTRTP